MPASPLTPQHPWSPSAVTPLTVGESGAYRCISTRLQVFRGFFPYGFLMFSHGWVQKDCAMSAPGTWPGKPCPRCRELLLPPREPARAQAAAALPSALCPLHPQLPATLRLHLGSSAPASQNRRRGRTVCPPLTLLSASTRFRSTRLCCCVHSFISCGCSCLCPR